MAIRFSCECGATFEVPDHQAGLRGRCLGCGKELSIPHADAPMEESRPEAPQEEISVHEAGPKREEAREQFCPYCGTFMGEDEHTCAACHGHPRSAQPVDSEAAPFTATDWVLATALPPLGMVAGFVLLGLGKKKGLDVLGISAIAILVWWVVFLLLGWIE